MPGRRIPVIAELQLRNRTAAMSSVAEQQKYFQSVHKLTHLKGKGDRLTSVIIPFAFVAATGALAVSCNLSRSLPFSRFAKQLV